jgi:hypothetical protein
LGGLTSNLPFFSFTIVFGGRGLCLACIYIYCFGVVLTRFNSDIYIYFFSILVPIHADSEVIRSQRGEYLMRYIWILVLGRKQTCLRAGIIVIRMHVRGNYNAVRRMNDPHYVALHR